MARQGTSLPTGLTLPCTVINKGCAICGPTPFVILLLAQVILLLGSATRHSRGVVWGGDRCSDL